MLTFTSQEIKDIIISTIVLAIAFGGLSSGFVPALLVIAIVFLTHELLGHKLVAQHYGCDAQYKKWNFGLGIALISGLLGGTVFAAPGAVYIRPNIRKGFAWTIHRITTKQMAIIAAAGPVVNIIFGFLFLLALPYSLEFSVFIYLAAKFSFFLALFNMLPFWILDGAKVSKWSWHIWGIITAAGVIGYLLL